MGSIPVRVIKKLLNLRIEELFYATRTRNCNNDDRCLRQKQGVIVGAVASETRAPPKARSGCWEPQPGRAAARSAVSNQPSGLLLSPRFPIFRNVYQESTACRSTVCRASVGRYRTRTAAEPTTACGGNREARLGPRSDFSRPRQGAAEKSANATRQGRAPQLQLL